MISLFQKDLSALRFSLWPAILLSIPLLVILEFTTSSADIEKIRWQPAFWIVFFFCSTNLLFRSFSLEVRNKNFYIYSAAQTPRLQIFLSQTLINTLGLALMGLAQMLILFILWSPQEIDLASHLGVLLLASTSLAPVGTLLGLMLQLEREFLFSLFFLPLAAPLVLAAFNLSMEWSWTWASMMIAFCLISSFLSALAFEFFFDELSQSH